LRVATSAGILQPTSPRCMSERTVVSSVKNAGLVRALASHDMDLIRNLCNRVIWLEHGVIKQFGSPATVISAYLNTTMRRDPGVMLAHE
jgi:ABC-type polysaccharide/polyol phosphate transport system ATPase subunit